MATSRSLVQPLVRLGYSGIKYRVSVHGERPGRLFPLASRRAIPNKRGQRRNGRSASPWRCFRRPGHTISERSVRKSYSTRAAIRPLPEGFPRDFVFADREAILRKPYHEYFPILSARSKIRHPCAFQMRGSTGASISPKRRRRAPRARLFAYPTRRFGRASGASGMSKATPTDIAATPLM
jgi:hypothetical protein